MAHTRHQIPLQVVGSLWRPGISCIEMYGILRESVVERPQVVYTSAEDVGHGSYVSTSSTLQNVGD